MARIVVLGAGVVGQCTAMLLAEDGHDVVVLERDAAGPAATPEEAWSDWDRRGVNQFRLPHFFLARYRAILDAELPRVSKSIESVGGLRTNILLEIPESIRGPEQPGDGAFEVLTARRPVMELAVSTAANATPGLEIRRGVAADGLLTGTSAHEGTVHVVGVRTSDGEELRADLVVDLMGRRSPMPRLLEDAGGRPPDEELEDFGFMYYGRHYRSKDGSVPFSFGPALQHCGTISSLTLTADNGTWGVTLLASAGDKALLGLRDPGRWEQVVRSLPLVAHWLDGEPIEDRIITISKIEDRIRHYVVAGAPVATGVVSIGDAWACSNPSLGRGASIGMVHAVTLRQLLRDVGLADPMAFARAFGEATDAAVLPWFLWTRDQDRRRITEIAAGIRGEPYEPEDDAAELECCLSASVGKDPELTRHFIAAAMVLEPLDATFADPASVARIRELGSGWRDEPIPGPDRDALLTLATA
jgi:2-polyprenyl-6-methoxyphenol hydroxylase-like FAD-dependent oxidoreductase